MELSYEGGKKLPVSEGGCDVYRFDEADHTLLLTCGLSALGFEFAARVRGDSVIEELAGLLRFWADEIGSGQRMGDYDTLALTVFDDGELDDHVAYLTPDPRLAGADVRVLGWRIVTPALDAALAGLPLKEVGALLDSYYPGGVSDMERLPDVGNAKLEQAIDALQARVPARVFVDGLDFELRLGAEGRSLTLLMMPRHLASLAFPLQKAFAEGRSAQLHADSMVTIESDDECHEISFRASSDGRARFRVRDIEVVTLDEDEEEVPLSDEKQQQLALLPLETLATEHGLMRRLEVELEAPPEVLRGLLSWAQQTLKGHDFDAKPVVALDWSEHLSDEPTDGWGNEAGRGLEMLRLWVVSAGYFMGDLAIDDEGNAQELEDEDEDEED